MKFKGFAALITAAFVSTGCAAQMEQSATKQAAAQCAEKGMQFVKTDSKRTEAVVVSSATVSGECVGPGDPRYIPSASSTPN